MQVNRENQQNPAPLHTTTPPKPPDKPASPPEPDDLDLFRGLRTGNQSTAGSIARLSQPAQSTPAAPDTTDLRNLVHTGSIMPSIEKLMNKVPAGQPHPVKIGEVVNQVPIDEIPAMGHLANGIIQGNAHQADYNWQLFCKGYYDGATNTAHSNQHYEISRNLLKIATSPHDNIASQAVDSYTSYATNRMPQGGPISARNYTNLLETASNSQSPQARTKLVQAWDAAITGKNLQLNQNDVQQVQHHLSSIPFDSLPEGPAKDLMQSSQPTRNRGRAVT